MSPSSVPQATRSQIRPRLLPYLALAAGILSLSTSAIFVRWANAPGPVMSLYRTGLAALVMAPLYLLNRRRQPASTSAPQAGRFASLLFPLIGGLITAVHFAVWNTAVLYTTAANATLLANTAPLWVALAALALFHERLAKRFWVGLVLTLAGAAFVLGYDFLQNPNLGNGNLLALTAAFFYASYMMLTQRGRQHLDALSYSWMVNLFAGLTLLILCLLLGLPITGYSSQSYLAFLAAALINQVVGYLVISYALGHLPASIVSPTMLGQPVLAALLAIPLLGEQMRPVQWLGTIAVLGGIYLVNTSRSSPYKSAASDLKTRPAATSYPESPS